MLIDRSYFIGELNIPNTNQPAIGGLLDAFIQKYEPLFLEKVLGYALYQALIAGYSVPSPDQKWIDLVQGVEYTSCGRLTKWKGLVTQPVSVLDAFDALNDDYVIVGRGQQYDPVSATNSVTIPPAYVGKPFRLFNRAIGQLLPTEYSVAGNTLTLTTGQFSVNDVYFYKAATLSINTITGANKESPIAMYVYYWYSRNEYTQRTSMSEVKQQTENAVVSTPAAKMERAWNDMRVWVCHLLAYLNFKKDTYTEWNYRNGIEVLHEFGPINEHNI